MILEQVDHKPLIRARSVYRDFWSNPGVLCTIVILLLKVYTVPFTFHVCIAMQDAYY